MSRILKLVTGIIVVLLVLLAVSAIYAVTLVRGPFPQTEGALIVPGLQDDVHVYRDEFGVPHIYANNLHDLFFAQGYVHAQDRFWQMEFWRHVSAGRLAEILGERLVETDTFIRTMGWNRIAQDTLTYYEAEEPELMAVLQDYSEGVNAYIAQNREQLSLNVTILQRVNGPWEIEPWAPLDTVGWSVVMADDLSGNWNAELQRARLIKALGEERAAALLPLYPSNRPVIVPTGQMGSAPQGLPWQGRAARAAPEVAWSRLSTELIGVAPGDGLALGGADFVGSNNWVIAGEHTDTGMPLLADDPHLGIQMPSIWYEVGLHAPGLNVVGFSFAGVPAVVIGHNERIAWGVTNTDPDVQDLYIERINP
ncbi:MAG: penicillin acylase family protein, partial [Ardenticatenaceae bacterium]